jgi:hypothetical protein
VVVVRAEVEVEEVMVDEAGKVVVEGVVVVVVELQEQ